MLDLINTEQEKVARLNERLNKKETTIRDNQRKITELDTSKASLNHIVTNMRGKLEYVSEDLVRYTNGKKEDADII